MTQVTRSGQVIKTPKNHDECQIDIAETNAVGRRSVEDRNLHI